MAELTVSHLYVYPVKSCAGIRLDVADLDGRGIANDRRWMVVRPDGRFISQRECARMALIHPGLTVSGELTLEAPGGRRIAVASRADIDENQRTVSVWSATVRAVDEGDGPADWLSDVLSVPCRLVRAGGEYARKTWNPQGEAKIAFVDDHPFLIISEASLDDLNSRLPSPVPMNRFRPNIVVGGASAYAEDGWERVRIGQVIMSAGDICSRCVITTIDQSTAVGGVEPLRTLSTYRRDGDKVLFGRYFAHTMSGRINVGDLLTVIQ